MMTAFEAAYHQRFSFLMPDKPVIVEAVSVEVTRASDDHADELATAPSAGTPEAPAPARVRMFTGGAWAEVDLLPRSGLRPGRVVRGPALITEDFATTVVEPGWQAGVTGRGDLLLTRPGGRPDRAAAGPGERQGADPVMLEIFNNLFMSVAEQMGVRLQSTAHSVNIKERLDFSCAVFDAAGQLIANAPHMPVHLGSMGESIRMVISRNRGSMQPGDVFMLNDPYHGGTHLPDITVVTPVFADGGGDILFYVASRGHHAEIGGITPGSMPAFSTRVDEEGVLIDNWRLAGFTGQYPWQWQPADGEAFICHLRSPGRGHPVVVSTARGYEGALALFMEYVTDPRYGWPGVCGERFGEVPQQIFHEGNTVCKQERLAQVVCNKDHSFFHALLQIAEFLLHFRTRYRIKRTERFIKKQNRRIGRQRPRHPHSLALPPGKLFRIAVGKTFLQRQHVHNRQDFGLVKISCFDFTRVAKQSLHRIIGQQSRKLRFRDTQRINLAFEKRAAGTLALGWIVVDRLQLLREGHQLLAHGVLGRPAVQRSDAVLGGHGLPIMEQQAVAQGEGVGELVVAHFPAFEHLRLDLQLVVDRQQRVVDHVAVVAHDIGSCPKRIDDLDVRMHDDFEGLRRRDGW